jgi:putative DNA primase/helicase
MHHNLILPQQDTLLQDVTTFITHTRTADGWYEFRLLAEGKPPIIRWWKHGDNEALQHILSECLQLNQDGYNVYMTLNPAEQKPSGSTKDDHVSQLALLLVDVDPVRPKVEVDGKLTDHIPSTNAERNEAVAVMHRVKEFLQQYDVTPIAILDSGNGAQLLLKASMPASSSSSVHTFLSLLNKAFGNSSARIDSTVSNPARIARLPGFINYKGRELPDRPYRIARAWRYDGTTVTEEILQSMIDELRRITGLEQQLREPAPEAHKKNGNGDTPADWFNRHATIDTMIDLARRYGYSDVGQRGDYYEMTRPGKDGGISGGWRLVDGVPVYINFSCNDPFIPADGEANSVSAFGFYTQVMHNGNASEAAKAVIRGIPELGIPPMPGQKQQEASDIDEITQALAKAAKLLKEVAKERKEAEPKEAEKFTHIQAAELVMQEVQVISLGKDAEEMYRYDAEAGLWRDDAEAYIEHILRIRDLLPNSLKRRSFVNEVVAHIRGTCWKAWEHLPDAPATLIPFANGVLDLNTGELREYRPEDYFTSKLPWAYDPSADSTIIKKRLEAFDPSIRQHFMELLAYCLYRDYPLQRFFIWTGAGSNGKSYLFKLLIRAIGPENTAGETMHSISENRFAAANLYRKLANIAGEVSASDLNNTDMLKRLTGGDMMEADRKFLSPIRFRNYAKLIFAMNSVPPTSDNTDAFYRRSFIVKFEKQFQEDSKVETELDLLPKEQLAREFAWLLTQAVTELKRLFANGFRMTGDAPVEQKRQTYEDLSKPLRHFMEQFVERTDDYDDYIPKFEFRDRLNEYLHSRKLMRYTDRRIAQEMRELGIGEEYRTMPGGQRWWCWIGIRWKGTTNTSSDDSTDNVSETTGVKDVKDVNLLYTGRASSGEGDKEEYSSSSNNLHNLHTLHSCELDYNNIAGGCSEQSAQDWSQSRDDAILSHLSQESHLSITGRASGVEDSRENNHPVVTSCDSCDTCDIVSETTHSWSGHMDDDIEWRVLALLPKSPRDSASASWIADQLNEDIARVAAALSSLEKYGFAARDGLGCWYRHGVGNRTAWCGKCKAATEHTQQPRGRGETIWKCTRCGSEHAAWLLEPL